MNSLKIGTGEISLNIIGDNGESRGIFKFNPTDVESAKQIIILQKDLIQKQIQFENDFKGCETPEEQINFLSDVVQYFNSVIDRCFGEGSSQILFGDAKSLTMYEDFFNGITPYYEKASNDRLAKYQRKGGK